jgi:hypothetical protein
MLGDDTRDNDWITTPVDPKTRLFRKYPHAPTCDPDKAVPLAALCDSPEIVQPDPRPRSWWSGMTASLAGLTPSRSVFAPLLNITHFRLLEWKYNSKDGVSAGNMETLCQDVHGAPDFNLQDSISFRVPAAEALLDREDHFAKEDGWIEATLDIPVPSTGAEVPESHAARFAVSGFFYRRLVPVIVSFFETASRELLHFTPFEIYLQLSDGTSERIFTEFYNSVAWVEEHLKTRAEFKDKMRGAVDIAIAGIILYSDSTHLAQFGTKAAWPIYAFFANESKHTRNKPTKFSAQHIGYIPSVRVRLCALSAPAELGCRSLQSLRHGSANTSMHSLRPLFWHISSEKLCRQCTSCFWTTSLWRRMFMGFQSPALMGLCD